MNPLIEARDIRKSYRQGPLETAVLRGVDLSLETGSMTAVMGASGAGKSTLLHILGSLDPPNGGKVLFRGENLYQKGDRELSLFRNREIGFVFQEPNLIAEMTVVENVMIPLLIRGVGEGEGRQKSLEALSFLNLDGQASKRPAELSGGEQQRVAIARAVVGRPSLLLADEPTGNLDRENGENLMNLLARLQREEGLTLIMATHNESLAGRFSHRYHLKDGRLSRNP